MKIYLKIIILAVILILSVFFWYSPVLFKGYSAAIPGANQVIAKNLIKAGKFSQENEKNIILSSDRIKTEGVVSSTGDKAIALASAALYKISGLPGVNLMIFLTVIIFALSLLFFFLTVWKLFNYWIAVIFAAIYIVLPVIWETSLRPGLYEFSLLFLSVGLFLFFIDWKKYNGFRYCLAGIFLALSFLSRDAVALLAPVLLVWLWFYKRKAISPVFIPMILVVVCFTAIFQSSFGKTGNYHLVFFRAAEQGVQGRDFSFYGHLYPDPYTYHYEREQYLKQQKEILSQGGVESVNISKRLSNVEAREISLLEHFRVAPVLLIKHLSSLISLESVGGPLTFLLFCFGLINLYRQGRRDLVYLIVGWISFVFIFCSLFALAQRNHVMDFGFVFALGVALGIYNLMGIFKFKHKYLALGLVVITAVYQLILSSHVLFGRIYDDASYLKLKAYQERVLSSNITNKDIIAAPFSNTDIYGINYLTDKSFVKFDDKTVEKLLEENKIDFAFKEFGVIKILGYSPETTKKITEQTGVENIADNSIKAESMPVSPAKSLFMNLVK